MSETKVKKEKVIKRGLSVARGTSRKRISHESAKPNGLFLVHLDNVEVKDILIGEDTTGMPSFNGMNIPKIVFTFATNEDEVNKRQYVTLSFNAVESNALTIPGQKEDWKVNSVFDWLKHILDVYLLKGRDLTDKEAEALSLSFEDFDENGEYVPVEPEVVVSAWRSLFNNFENIMNRGRDNETPIYKTKEGKVIPVWAKLLRYTKHSKKGWMPIDNGNLAFTAFVGDGRIEMFKQNTSPGLRIDVIKETIFPMNVEKPKQPNMQNINTMNNISNPGININESAPFTGNPFSGDNVIINATSSDLPF